MSLKFLSHTNQLLPACVPPYRSHVHLKSSIFIVFDSKHLEKWHLSKFIFID